jgi:hypothetical protein
LSTKFTFKSTLKFPGKVYGQQSQHYGVISILRETINLKAFWKVAEMINIEINFERKKIDR